ncbi:MAG: hypothetical protein RIQ33_1641 [Bacteroidota bacterium]|jgi:hypothetical protein
MKNLFDNDVHLEIMNRLHSLHEGNQRLWGTMSAAQMLSHASIPFEYALGDRKGKQSFIGKIFKPFAQNTFFDEKPYKQGLPTAPEFKAINNSNFEAEKQRLLQLIIRFNTDGKKVAHNSIHLFLGRISAEQWARTMYKHLDHHFRQFGI